MNRIRDIAFTGLPYAALQMEGSDVQKRQSWAETADGYRGAESGAEAVRAAHDEASARRRKAQTERRLHWLEARWNDDTSFWATAKSGRYLKLCMLIEWASTLDAEAGARLAAVKATVTV